METNKKWVLVVDDDQNSRDIFRKYLTEMGLEVVLAHDGEDAMDILARGPYIDLIITDVMMPYMSGLDLTKKVKTNADTANIPVIGTSAFHDWKKAREDHELVVDEFIPKPIDGNVLRATIEKVLRVEGR